MRKLTFIIILLLCASSSAFAREYPAFGPLTLRNQSPLYLQFANLVPDDAKILDKGQFETRIDSAYSNVYERTITATHDLDLDMELWRVALDASYGVGKNFELGIEIPFLHFEGGFLDEFIQDYHNAFGFPNGGRQYVANGLFAYRLDVNGATIYQVDREAFNLGDITARYKHHVFDETRFAPAVAYTFYLKLPTGQRDEGLGNGCLGYGLAAALEKSYKRLHGYLNAGWFFTGGHDPLIDYQYSAMFSYMTALEFTLLDSWSLVTQIVGGTPLFNGAGNTRFDGIPMDLNIGTRGEEKGLIFGNDLIWQFGFQEDIYPEGPSVDFTVFASVGLRFNAD